MGRPRGHIVNTCGECCYCQRPSEICPKDATWKFQKTEHDRSTFCDGATVAQCTNWKFIEKQSESSIHTPSQSLLRSSTRAPFPAFRGQLIPGMTGFKVADPVGPHVTIRVIILVASVKRVSDLSTGTSQAPLGIRRLYSDLLGHPHQTPYV